MKRVELSVPYAEKDVAKALGAKWDVANKLWYLPEGIASEPFRKWLSNPRSLARRFNVTNFM